MFWPIENFLEDHEVEKLSKSQIMFRRHMEHFDIISDYLLKTQKLFLKKLRDCPWLVWVHGSTVSRKCSQVELLQKAGDLWTVSEDEIFKSSAKAFFFTWTKFLNREKKMFGKVTRFERILQRSNTNLYTHFSWNDQQKFQTMFQNFVRKFCRSRIFCSRETSKLIFKLFRSTVLV